jgi:hypothetical protein
MYFKLGLETAPVIGCLILLASTCIPGSVIRDGIVGSEGVRPYDIMTLFLSFVSLLPSCIRSLFPHIHSSSVIQLSLSLLSLFIYLVPSLLTPGLG